MIRFIIICIALIPFILIGYPFLWLEWLIGKINKRAKDTICLHFVKCACHLVLWLGGVKVKVIGKENIPRKASLIVANHRSIFDIIILYANCKMLTGFVAKNSLEKIPFLRAFMKNLYCLFLDRSDIKQGLQVILQAIQYAKDGISVGIFPEGTRGKGDGLTLLPFKEGSFKISLKSGCPIVPVAIYYDAPVFEDHIPRLKKTTVILEYLPPISPQDLSKDEQKVIGATCQAMIQDAVQKNAKSLQM